MTEVATVFDRLVPHALAGQRQRLGTCRRRTDVGLLRVADGLALMPPPHPPAVRPRQKSL